MGYPVLRPVSAPNLPINAYDFGVRTTEADVSQGLSDAITFSNAEFAAGRFRYIYVPEGIYNVTGAAVSTLPTFVGGGGIVGRLRNKTFFKMGVNYVGALFSWSEAWLGADSINSIPIGGEINLDHWRAGPVAREFTVAGSRSAVAQQHAIVFYDRTDLAQVDSIDVLYVKGSAFACGRLKNKTEAYMRESWINNFRTYYSGDVGTPAVDIHSEGTTIGSNEIQIGQMDIYGNYGAGLAIINNSSGSTPSRDIRIGLLRIEGLDDGTNVAADLLQIGSSTALGNVNSVVINQVNLISPYLNYAAMRLTASAANKQPYNIVVQRGKIGGGNPLGKGLVIDYGRNNYFKLTSINTTDTNIQIGPSTQVGGANIIDGDGLESTWTWSIDATSKTSFATPILKYGQLGDGALVAHAHDSTDLWGNDPGAGAVDLQMSRLVKTQVAKGGLSVIAGGAQNRIDATGVFSAILGGFNSSLSGAYTVAIGGRQSNDYGRTGVALFGSGVNAAQGDAQMAWAVLRGTGAAGAVRLTSDGAAASSVNINNIPANSTHPFLIILGARNITTAGSDYTWFVRGTIARDASLASTVLQIGTPEVFTRGTTAGAAVSCTADTTNGGFNLSFTAPVTDTWHIGATFLAQEVR